VQKKTDYDFTYGYGTRLAEDNPSRAGKIVKSRETGRFLILLPECITSEMSSSIKYAMEFRGFDRAVDVLADPLTFLRHLVLHEIAHGIDDAHSEQDCDRWAFEQLAKLPSNPAVEGDACESALRASSSAPHRER
jgi:hypothetical protein